MAREKSNLLIAAEWLWSNRKRNIWWRVGVLTDENEDKTAPKLTLVEARSVFKTLEERGLVFKPDDGRLIYHLHEAKEQEWNTFLSELCGEKPKPIGDSDQATEAPPITQFLDFVGYHITKNCHNLKSAWIAVVSIAAIAFYLGWLLASNILVASKDATIEQLRTANELSGKETEKLARQLADLNAYRSDAIPLKKKAMILVQQIKEFTAGWKDTDTDAAQNENVQKYLTRFGLRVQIIRDDFDQAGQHSDSLDKAVYEFAFSYTNVQAIALEIEKLATNLRE